MDNDERRKIIIDYVAKNQGCKVQDIVDGLYGIIARPTIFNILPGLIKDGVIKDEKYKQNNRNHKLFVDMNNPLVLVPKELEEFKSCYLKLMDEAMKKVSKKDVQLTRDLLVGVIDLFHMLTSAYLFRSTINWPLIIHDAETLNELNRIMLTKFVEIQSSISQKLAPSLGILRTYDLLQNISGSRILQYDQIFKKFNLEKEKSQVIGEIHLERLYGNPPKVLPS
jgi:hypothetical protein